MSSLARLTGAPPCPFCGRDVRELETVDHSVDVYIDPLTVFNVATRRWSYVVHPCGHEVDGFKAKGTRILEWSTAPY